MYKCINQFIPYGKQDISEADIAAVVETLHSDWLTQGPAIKRFEQALADYCHVKHAVACANATAALHLACLALTVGPQDTVWTSPNTFLASANCARYCGARVDFVDIDPKTYNLCPQKLAEKLKEAAAQKQLPKLIIPVHFSGQSADMQAIYNLAKTYDIAIVEDASHAIGGSYQQQKIGSCRYSDIAIFSFHPVKIMTTGEGGVLLTNSDELADKLRSFACHGMTRDVTKMHNPPTDEPWYYEQIALGYNYRITDLQCALGFSQLQRLDEFIKKRQALVNRYHLTLKDLPLILPYQHPDCQSSHHLYVICLHPEYQQKTRKEIFNTLRKANIGVNVHYIPVHTQLYYQKLGYRWGDFPIAEDYYHRAITLPLFPTMTTEQQDYVIEVLKEALQ